MTIETESGIFADEYDLLHNGIETDVLIEELSERELSREDISDLLVLCQTEIETISKGD